MQSQLADLILSETPGKTPAAEADRRLALKGRAESAAQPQYGYWDCAAASPKIGTVVKRIKLYNELIANVI